MRLTDDLTMMTWLPPGKAGESDKEPDPEEKWKEIAMHDIQAS